MTDRERAREIAEVLCQAGDGFVYLPGVRGMSRYAYIEAALAAVRAETVERAAKIADREAQEAQQAIDRGDYDADDIPMGQHGASARIAATIRSLKTGDTDV